MTRSTTLAVLAVTLILVLPVPSATAAPIIVSQATDLGGGSWRYDYTLSSDWSSTLLENRAIVIYFGYLQFSGLVNGTASPLPGWDTWVFDSDPGIPADGEFDALALIDAPALPVAFSVRFTWLGKPGTTPGVQPFDVLQFDSAGSVVGVVDSGTTTTIPEPGSLMLLGLGLAGLVRARAKR